MCHFVEGDCFDSTLGGYHEISEMLVFHVLLPAFAGFPVFEEEKMGRVFFVLVEIVVEAAFLGASGLNEVQEFRFDQVNLIGLGVDIADDGEFGHGFQLFDFIPSRRW